MEGFTIIILIVYLAIDIWFAVMVNEAAIEKGYDSHFVLCLLFGIIAFIYVAALPDLKLRQTNQEILRKLERLETGNDQPRKSYMYNEINNELPDI